MASFEAGYYYKSENITISYEKKNSSWRTALLAFETEILIDRKIENIAMFVILGFIAAQWRNSIVTSTEPASYYSIGAKISCGLSLLGLACVGLLESIARLTVALILWPFLEDESDQLLTSAIEGFECCFMFATFFQVDNFSDDPIFQQVKDEKTKGNLV